MIEYKQPALAINWLQYRFLWFDGYGRYGMSLLRELVYAGVDVQASHVLNGELPGWIRRLTGMDFSRLTFNVMPPYEMQALPTRQWCLTMYEDSGVPDTFVQAANEMCERIIVPCDMNADAFRECGLRETTPISVIGGGVDVREFPLRATQEDNFDRPYVFLAHADRGLRKGWDIVHQAFYQAFGDNRDVRLVIKARPNFFETLGIVGIGKRDQRVSFWLEDVRSMADVFAQVDCFVFPSRGEGWGMPPREAACMGLPVIATRFGGLVDGIDNWAIPIETFTLRRSTLPTEDGQWALSDVDEVAAHMKWCYDNREAAAAKGKAAASWLRENQSWEKSASRLLTLLEQYG